MKLILANGTTGFTDDNGKWICTGSQIGRPNILPKDKNAPVKLQLVKLRMVDQDYDSFGAYWGCGPGTTAVYCGFADGIYVFTRGWNRESAKQGIWKVLPNARFYR